MERVPTSEIVAQWARDPSMQSAGDVRHAISSLLRSETASCFLCGGCGLEMLAPAVAWTSDTYPRQGYYLAFDHAAALARLRDRPPLRLLELGCGDGLFMEAVAGLGHEVTGLDFVDSAVRSACARGLDARTGDVASLRRSIGADRFDVVALFQLLEHVPDPDGLLQDLHAISRPGGELLIGVPAPRRFSRRVRHAGRIGSSDFWDWPPQHALRWTGAALRHALSRNGWEVTSVVAEPFTWLGAAAYLVASDGQGTDWYRHPVRRRAATAAALLRLAAARIQGPITGIRLFVAARRQR